jgi:hypothetical protein
MRRCTVIVTAVVMLLSASGLFAPGLAQARTLNCTPQAIEACKAEIAPLCRQAPQDLATKCLDDLAEQCETPAVLCETSLFDTFARRFFRFRRCTREDPMDINPDPSQPGSPRIVCR